jgi:hypothetical protein
LLNAVVRNAPCVPLAADCAPSQSSRRHLSPAAERELREFAVQGLAKTPPLSRGTWPWRASHWAHARIPLLVHAHAPSVSIRR